MSISLDSIGIAADDTAPYSLSEYYGVQFTDGTTSPASGEISLNDFLNKTIGSAWNQSYYRYLGSYPETNGMSYDGTRIAYPASNNLSVYVYEKSNGTWSLIGTISTPDGVFSIGLSGDGSRVMVSERTYNNYQGRARVYQYAGGTTWNQVGGDITGTTYVLYDGTYITGSWGGWSADISGDGNSVVMGEANYDDPNINFSTTVGRVTVWHYSNGSWSQRGTGQIGTHYHPKNISERYGSHVSISHDGTIYAAAGGGYYNSSGVRAGRAKVFQYTNGSWNQLGQDLMLYNEAVRPRLSGDGMKLTLCDYGSSSYQTVSVLEYYNNTWNQTFSAPYTTRGSISRDGSTITVSRYTLSSSTSYTDVYEWDGSNWVQKGSRIDGIPYIGLSARLSEDGSSYIITGRYGVYVYEFLG